ncbi:CvpA family protein [Ottowia thiooxydans]|uniref:CvpA family protein n=1 Tax=Ottowia thiooxydans TaxID=219182 RepID=UPI00049129E6|nr:CvpA family protein [Ottowia thiooxydans]
MSGVDWICLTVAVASLLLGAWRGFLYEVLALGSWVFAFFAARWAAPVVGLWLPMGESPEGVRYAAGFALVFISAAFLGGMLAWAARRGATALGVRPVDRVFGAVFGAARGLALLLVGAAIIGMTPAREALWWQESVSAHWLEATLGALHPMLPEPVGKYFPPSLGEQGDRK